MSKSTRASYNLLFFISSESVEWAEVVKWAYFCSHFDVIEIVINEIGGLIFRIMEGNISITTPSRVKGGYWLNFTISSTVFSK